MVGTRRGTYLGIVGDNNRFIIPQAVTETLGWEYGYELKIRLIDEDTFRLEPTGERMFRQSNLVRARLLLARISAHNRVLLPESLAQKMEIKKGMTFELAPGANCVTIKVLRGSPEKSEYTTEVLLKAGGLKCQES